jgi:Terminase large subunit, T4likevirus-type, N-terminal
MSVAHLRQRVTRLKAKFTPPPAVPVLPPMSPVELWQQTMGTDPDPWQETVLTSDDPRICLNCCRQAGKSSVVAVKALHIGLYQPKSLILLLSRALRQSAELARKVFDAYQSVARERVPAESESKLALELSNGSRILALPGGDEGALRGFSNVRALVLDEASRIPDSLWVAVRPMIAVSGGSLMVLSTPFGKRGFFYRVWTQSERWLKIQVTAEQCPRLTPDFLAEELIELGPRWYAQEYGCKFVEAVGQVFPDDVIDAAFSHDVVPLFADGGDDDGALADLPALFAGACG